MSGALAVPDYSIVGSVLAISLVIMVLSGLALYVAFRVRETFREERGRGVRTAKVAFLIGLLFLSGGVFYFFTGGVRTLDASVPTASTTSSALTTVSSIIVTTTTVSPPTTSSTSQSASTSTAYTTTSSTSTSSTSTASTTSTTSSTSAVSTSTTTTASASGPAVSMTLSYPSKVAIASVFDFSITVVNGGPGTANSVAVQAGDLFSTFTLVSSNYPVSGNVIVVGDVAPGSVVVDLQLMAPAQPQQFSGAMTLTYQQMSGPLSTPVTIRVSQSVP